jgi:hypothetical protein
VGKQLAFVAESPTTHHTREFLRALNAAFERAGIRRVRTIAPLREIGGRGSRFGLHQNLGRWSPTAYLVGLSWPRDGTAWPRLHWSEIIPYVFDCWPPDYDFWVRKLRGMRPRVVFVSARGSADYLREQLPDTDVHWLPEALNLSDWDPGPPLVERSIDLLELGRRHEEYHESITNRLRPGITHEFSGRTAEFLFPGEHGLRGGLADSKLQVCFPKSATHPDRGPGSMAGGVPGAMGLETVTQRYFEVMAAGGLILGQIPRELIDLFGYDPGIRADLEHPVEQIHDLIDHIEEYQPLVERNHEAMREVGTWDARVQEMLRVLSAAGYELPRG